MPAPTPSPDNRAAKEAQDIAETVKSEFKSVGQNIKDEITKGLVGASQAARDFAISMSRDLTDMTKSLGTQTKTITSNIKLMNKGLLDQEQVESQIEAIEERRKVLARALVDAARQGVLRAQEARKIQQRITDSAKEQVEAIKKQLQLSKMVQAQREHQTKMEKLQAEIIEKRMGSWGRAMEGLNKIPLVGNLINANQVLAKMKKTAEEGGSKMKVFAAGVSETFKSIGDTLTSPAFIIGGLIGLLKTLVKLATEYEQKQFDAAKDLGVSVERGKVLRQHFVDIMRSNIMLGLTADELQKAYAGIQDEVGVIVKQSDEFLVTTAQIQRRTGATNENMAMMQVYAKKTHQSLTSAYQTIIGTAKATGARLRLEMSEKQIMEAMSKTSATVLENFHGNFKALASAVVQAKALGTTLDKINATQDGFLDFEQSIGKQFEAEVLTGKELDTQRARQLAENHDTVGLMKEMNRLIGDRAAWDKLGTLEQQAKAEALNMQRDTINEMYVTQERTKLLGEAAGEDLKTQYDYLVKHHATQKQIEDTLGAQAVQSMQQASTAERMNVLMESIKATIGEMAQAIIPFVTKMLEWLSHVENIKKVLKITAGIIGAIVGYSITMRILGAQQVAQQMQLYTIMVQQNAAMLTALSRAGLLTAEEAARAGASVTAGSGYLGPGAIAVGTAAIAALMAYSIAGSAMGGGGGDSTIPDVPSPGGISAAAATTPTMPSTPSVAAESTTISAPSIAPASAPVASSGGTMTVNLVVDGAVLASKMIDYMPKDHKTHLDNSTGRT